MVFTSIALSGLPGAGKTSLMERLAMHFNWEIFYIGDRFKRRHEEWLKNNPQMAGVDFPKYWASFVTREEIEDINEEGRDKLKNGKIILDSRYAPVNALGLDTALLVYVFAPLLTRAQRAVGNPLYKKCKTTEEIKRVMEIREGDEVARGRRIYSHLFGGNFDYQNKELYDLTLNAGRLSINEELSAVVGAVEASRHNNL